MVSQPRGLYPSSRTMQERIRELIANYEAVTLLKVIYKWAEIALYANQDSLRLNGPCDRISSGLYSIHENKWVLIYTEH